MLDKQTIEVIKKTIKEINKEKNVENRLIMLIEHKDNIRNLINEELDELFSEVDLKPKRYQINDDILDDND